MSCEDNGLSNKVKALGDDPCACMTEKSCCLLLLVRQMDLDNGRATKVAKVINV